MRKDITGQKYERLTAIGIDEEKTTPGHIYWRCKCDCGNEVSILTANFGKTKSCGCYRRDKIQARRDAQIGKKYGRLTVVALDEEQTRLRKTAYFFCECECGNKVSIKESHFVSGRIQSCGCLLKEAIHRHVDLTGQKFGRLLVLGEAERRGAYQVLAWHCRCDCGNEADVRGTSLTSGNTRSCGCLAKDITIARQFKDLSGQRFGKLVAQTYFKKDNIGYWHCECDCGNEVDVIVGNLTHGYTHSCGCINYSIGEKNIQEILTHNDIGYEIEKTYEGLGSFRYPYRFDFYLPQKNRLIEFDGIQHFQPIASWDDTKEGLFSRQNRDKEKNKYAIEHNIELIRIPYWERDQITLDMLLGDQYLIIDEEGNYKNFTRQEMLSKNG